MLLYIYDATAAAAATALFDANAANNASLRMVDQPASPYYGQFASRAYGSYGEPGFTRYAEIFAGLTVVEFDAPFVELFVPPNDDE